MPEMPESAPAEDAPTADTLPQWLHQRFGVFVYHGNVQPWERLEDADRDYWGREAAAVRRAATRGGFKNPRGAA